MTEEEFNRAMKNRGKTYPSRLKLKWNCLKDPTHGTFLLSIQRMINDVQRKCPKCPIVKPKARLRYKDCVKLGIERDDLEFAMTEEEFQRTMSQRGDTQKNKTKKLKWRCKTNPNHIWENSYASIRDGSSCLSCGQRIALVGTYIHPILEYYSLLLLRNSGISVNYEHFIKSDDSFHPDLLIYCTEVFKERLSSFQDVLDISDSIKEISLDFTYSLNLTVMLEKCNKYYQAQTRYLIIILLREGTKLNADYFQNEIEQNSSVKFVENIKIINFETFLKYIGKLIGERDNEVLDELTKVRDFGIKAFSYDKAFKSLRNTSKEYKKKLASDFKNST